MLDSLLAPVAAWIVGVISAAGYVGVAGLMAVEPDQPMRARVVDGRKGPLAVVVEDGE